jgi:N-acetylated-alpha-linked acidic dipeptidase
MTMRKANHVVASLLLWNVVLASAVVAAEGPGVAPAITGFRASDAATERAREASMAVGIRADTLRKHLRILTSAPHVAGTAADRATAEYVRQRLEAYGWDAKIEPVPVFLNYPGEARLELIEPRHETLATRERGVDGDKDSFDSAAFDAFHGYAAAGDVTASAVTWTT